MLGLTSQDAESRMSRGLGNEQVDSSTRTVKEIVKENVLTYYNPVSYTHLDGYKRQVLEG